MHLRFPILFIIIFSLFLGCRRENFDDLNQSPEKEITVAEVKQWYNKTQEEKGEIFNVNIIKKIGLPDWKTAVWQKVDNKTPSLLTFNLNYDIGGYGFRKLIFTKVDGEVKAVILQAIGELSYLQKWKGKINAGDFTGDYHFLNLSGRFIEGCRVKDGKITFQLKSEQTATANLSARDNCESTAEGNNTNCEVTIYAYPYPPNSGWTYINVGMIFYYAGITYTNNGGAGYCQWCSTTPYGGGSGCTNCTPPPQPPPPPRPPLLIFDSLYNQCLKNVFNMLKNSGGDSNFFKNIYTQFDTANYMHLEFNHNETDSSVYAYTEGPYLLSTGDKALVISFNLNNMVNSSKEWMTHVFIHEIAHAGMYAGITNWDTASTQHQSMIRFHLEKMAYTIRAIHPNISEYDAYAMEFASFYNGSNYDSSVGQIIRNRINIKFGTNYLTDSEIADRGNNYSDIGTLGTRISCN